MLTRIAYKLYSKMYFIAAKNERLRTKAVFKSMPKGIPLEIFRNSLILFSQVIVGLMSF